jgi:putative peptide zinc metalloprotease protein
VRARPRRSLIGASVAVGVTLLLLFALPLPLSTTAEGGVFMPDGSELRAGADGFVTRVRVESGSAVELGAPLIETEDPVLRAHVRLLEARVRELEARRQSLRQNSPSEAMILLDETKTLQAELERARDRLASTTIRSPRSGIAVLPRANDLPGSYLERGAIVGYVTTHEQPLVRTLVSQRDVSLVRADTQSVSIRTLGATPAVLKASLSRERPKATHQLPGLAFGAAGGGEVAVDARRGDGLLAAESYFQFDLALEPDDRLSAIGSRVRVRFEHSAEPVGLRLMRAGRRLLMSQLGV